MKYVLLNSQFCLLLLAFQTVAGVMDRQYLNEAKEQFLRNWQKCRRRGAFVSLPSDIRAGRRGGVP